MQDSPACEGVADGRNAARLGPTRRPTVYGSAMRRALRRGSAARARLPISFLLCAVRDARSPGIAAVPCVGRAASAVRPCPAPARITCRVALFVDYGKRLLKSCKLPLLSLIQPRTTPIPEECDPAVAASELRLPSNFAPSLQYRLVHPSRAHALSKSMLHRLRVTRPAGTLCPTKNVPLRGPKSER